MNPPPPLVCSCAAVALATAGLRALALGSVPEWRAVGGKMTGRRGLDGDREQEQSLARRELRHPRHFSPTTTRSKRKLTGRSAGLLALSVSLFASKNSRNAPPPAPLPFQNPAF